MFYIVYKTTNTINDKIYIGAHKTKTLNYDGYLGSGKLLKKAVAKYGTKAFVRETLHVFTNPSDMYTKETEIVTEDFVNNPNTYNIATGGNIGTSSRKLAREVHRKIVQKRKDRYYTNPKLCVCGKPLRYEKKRNQYCSSSCAATINNTGRAVSDSQKEKVREKVNNRFPNSKTKKTMERRRKEKVEYQKHIYEKRRLIDQSNVDLTKRGWVTKLCEEVGLNKHCFKQWCKHNYREFYDERYGRYGRYIR